MEKYSFFNKYDGPIIDAHIHPFSEDFGENINRFNKDRDVDYFFNHLKSCGVNAACGSVIEHGHATWETIVKCNQTALRLRDRYPNFYIPGIHIHGDFVEESCNEIEKMYKVEGVRYIGELIPYSMHNGDYNSDSFIEICKVAEKLNMPVNIHANLEDTYKLVESCPNLPIVLAHPWDGAASDERIAYIAAHKNMYLDISGTGLFRYGMLKNAVEKIGANRILFGSDFPVCSIGMNVAGVLAEELTHEQFSAIFAENFSKLVDFKFN
jgi:predicted TIM-barrel fold metal-dependent hydrolase